MTVLSPSTSSLSPAIGALTITIPKTPSPVRIDAEIQTKTSKISTADKLKASTTIAESFTWNKHVTRISLNIREPILNNTERSDLEELNRAAEEIEAIPRRYARLVSKSRNRGVDFSKKLTYENIAAKALSAYLRTPLAPKEDNSVDSDGNVNILT